ncbi:receptor kinase 1 [Rhynchospora pubera]|uniref:Receptor kinase 1 n=1 Tax=Rhynchospora pubera TaxID=906938 RepID=A0AAV8G2C5_9POAL|nr:receptor kinase 1 [Rhynchospora pubera]
MTPSAGVFPSSDVQVFDLISLRNATNDFSEELGRGGFGKVYKGVIGGKEIAVKKLSEDSKQGPDEFKAEVELLGRLKHNNLVQLLGYCIEGTEKLICYEYLPNGSLDKLLFDRNNVNKLDWETRCNIILGICCGLRYVQEESINKIVHRDLKAGNILLDKDMIPKISDFGTARLFQDEQTHAITSKAIGTLGYLAPEYFREGKFSFKSDIYSFGIMLLEIVTGQPIIPPQSSDGSVGLVGNVVRNWTEGAADDLKDPAMGEAPAEEIRRYIQTGLCCINDSAENRPPMRQIELMLQGYCPIPDPQIPLVPNGWMPNAPSSATQTQYNSASSN